MNILPLIQKFTNTFNEKFANNFNIFNLESTLIDIGDSFTTDFLVLYLEYLDNEFCSSLERKNEYYVKDHVTRQLITSLGPITLSYRIYQSKTDKHCYSFIRDDVLKIMKYQRMTNRAECSLLKYAMSENMTQSSKHALRNCIVSRATVSNKIKNLIGTIDIPISKSSYTPKVIYIEMDEIHANLQHGGNRICPCAIVHEGHLEEFAKRKQLKNCYNFATSTLGYDGLWYVIYDYLDKKYDLDKIEYIFVSGDGADGIKKYNLVLPNAIFVLDKFHYRKVLNYIFKNPSLSNIADSYIRNKDFDTFFNLVQIQIEKYPDQKKRMLEKYNYILNNIDGIINQYHSEYKCPCSMEGHVSNKYARYITSSPYGFSERGLENKLKLLVLKANKHDLSIDDYLELKLGTDNHKILVDSFLNFKSNFKHLKDKFVLHNTGHASLISSFDPIENTILHNITQIKCTI